MEIALSELRPKASATVEKTAGCGCAELARLGLIPGTRVTCLRRCPLGGPAVYRFRGGVYALRRADAAGIRVRDEMYRDAETGRKSGG